jgi:DMSO/TMAO reductase YedYZ molybdopterin-dependent catalytic subunit
MAWRGAVAGLVAGGALVGALVAGLLTGGAPVLAAALAERTRALLPLHVLGYLIVRFKFAAKPLGFWVTMAAVVAVCAIAGGLWGARPRRWWGVAIGAAIAVAVALWAVGAAPALNYLTALYGAQGMSDGEAMALASRTLRVAVVGDALLAGLVFAAAEVALRRRARSAAVSVPSAGISRRVFLARLLTVAGALAGAAGLVQWIGAAAAHAGAVAQLALDRLAGRLPPEVTPTDKFYVVSKNPVGLDPKVDATKWQLEIGGLVGTPMKLTYDQIRAMPAVSRYHTLECISNEVGGDLIGNAMWKGVRFRDVIARAGGVSPKAIRFGFRCADGYTEGIPVMEAMHPDTMLAYEINGERLPFSHGFPLRILIPGYFGMKNPKWITKIEAVATNFTGYWEASGWTDEAVVKTTSMFRAPGPTAVIGPAGGVDVGGIAYAGDRGITDVEFSADGGKTWIKAETKKPLGPYTWVLWAGLWRPTGPGEYTLKARARDGKGVMQTAQEAPTLPDGASGYHTIRVRVRKP